MRKRVGVLELLHPTGAQSGTAVIGDHVPAALIGDETVDAGADLVVVDATAGTRELARVVAAAAANAIVVVFGRQSARRRAIATLTPMGFGLTRPGIAVRARGSVGPTLAVAGGRSNADRSLLEPVGGRRARLRGAGFTVCAPESAEPLAAWLPGPRDAAVVIRTSWRGPDESAVAWRLSGGNARVVAKLGLGSETVNVGDREAAAVATLGPHARAAGARTPELQATTTVAGRTAALLTSLQGRPLAQTSRHSLERAADAAVAWLGRFVACTSASARADAVIADAILGPARQAIAGLDGGGVYLDELHALAAAVGETVMPVAATHGDLTLWNVLEGELPGIVDWEGARAVAPPLVDLPYLLVDVRSTASRRGGRVDAFMRCFPEDRPTLDTSTARAITGLELPSAVVELAFHACWLEHAANERRHGVDGPFREILRIIAGRAQS